MEMESGKEDQELLTSMRVSTKMIRKMVMEFLSGKMEIYIRVIFNVMRSMDMVKCIGLMENLIRVNGSMIVR